MQAISFIQLLYLDALLQQKAKHYYCPPVDLPCDIVLLIIHVSVIEIEAHCVIYLSWISILLEVDNTLDRQNI